MMNAPFVWQECLEPGSVERTGLNASPSTMSKTFDFYASWSDVEGWIPHLLGYSKIVPLNEVPTHWGGAAVNGWRLMRFPPARHPKFPWLRATRILNIQGRGGKQNNTWTRVQSGQGWYASWDTAKISVLFESPFYPILEDTDTRAEYERYTLKVYETNVEQLARRGERWKFASATAAAVTATFPGDLLLKNPKGMLVWTWYGVPEDWIMLGRLVPTNLERAVGKVNQYPFPYYGNANQNTVGNSFPALAPNSVQFAPGTLLMMPVKISPATQVHPQIATGGPALLSPNFFPRTYDVTLTMIAFDPITDDTTCVRLTQPGGGFYDTTQIRGHNLVPLPRPSATGNVWYAAYKSGASVAGNVVQSDNALLYQYFDFETCFSWART